MRQESSGSALGMAALPFASVCDLVPDTCQHGGGLDEAVFDHINQLGLGDLDCMDDQLMSSLGNSDSQLQEDVDSDSGLSLESSSGGPVSPGGWAAQQTFDTQFRNKVNHLPSSFLFIAVF